jgi:DNA-binding transcriptional LysR family regulator
MAAELQLIKGVISILHVARAGSFRAAMRNSGKGFRTLDSDVKEVEAALGLLIFHRTSDGVVLTPEGRIIVESAQQIEETMTRIMRLGKSLGARLDGEVSLAATEGLGTFWLSPRLGDFQKLHDTITIRLHPSMAIIDMRRYEIDLAIQVVEPMEPEIKRLRLGTLHMMPSASPDYIARNGLPESVEDLARHSFVFHTSPQSSDRLIIEKAMGRKLRPNQFVVMRNSAAHYMMLERGDGIGFIPTYGFAIGARTVPIDLPLTYPLDIWLCFHAESRAIPRVSKVIDWLASVFDPRVYPWFRRDFVSPARFEQITAQSGASELMERLRFNR